MYDRMHDRTILATVTSPDDALDIQTLIRGGHIVREEQQPDDGIPITTYRTRQNHHIHLICDGNAPNLKYSAFGADDPTLAMPLILQATVGYEMARGHAISSERIGQLERQMMSHYLRIYQAVAAETEDYWHGRLR
uniref:Uncharacterized protein n=1 Tax=Candidatus Kentrum sp. LFY TaxID=2126342 RepID=A0A450V9C6_9GAMM|nr:MAG: hypothetical protein BECKLFY1418A_GA0070994_11447 [Candidatus Kentron sp. LFY]